MLITTIQLCVSPATIELLNKVMVTVTSNQDSENEETEKEIDYSDLWEQKPLVETDLWYLKTGNLSSFRYAVESFSLVQNEPFLKVLVFKTI